MFDRFRTGIRAKITEIREKTHMSDTDAQDTDDTPSDDADASSVVRRTFMLGLGCVGLVYFCMGIRRCGSGMLDLLGLKVSEAPASLSLPQKTPEGYDPDLVAAAYLEQKVTVYTDDPDRIQEAAKTFERLFGIVVDYQIVPSDKMEFYLAANSDDTNELNPSPSKHPVDVWFFADSELLDQAGGKNLLASYDAQHAEHLLKSTFASEKKLWYGVATDPLVLAINLERLEAMGLSHPRDWNDFLDSYLRDQIAVPEYGTTHSGNSLAAVMMGNLGVEQGTAFLTELASHTPQLHGDTYAMMTDLGFGRSLAAICRASEAFYTLGKDDFDNVVPLLPLSPTRFTTYGVGISAAAKHMNAARLWIEFCLSADFASKMETTNSFAMPAISGVKAPWYMDRVHLNGAVTALREAPQSVDANGNTLSPAQAGSLARSALLS